MPAAPAPAPAAEAFAFVLVALFGFHVAELGAAQDYVAGVVARVIAFGAHAVKWVAVLAALLGVVLAGAPAAAVPAAPVPAVLAA